jgi:hypothetical protein
LSNTVGDSLEAIDTAYAKLELIAGYIRFCDGATPRQQKAFDEPGFSGPWAGAPATGTTPAEDTDLVVQRERFLRCLSGKGRRSLAQAQLVLRQAEQGIFVKDVAAQLKNGAFAITMEPQTVRELEVVLLRVVFNEDKYNGSAARDKVDCVWTFTHGSIAMQEKGWQACHFFSEGEASVSVEFRRGSKVFVIPQPAGQSGGPATRSLQVGERTKDSRKEQTKLELVQLGVALGATMLALMAGAREQIQKLDLLAGVAVVFALGFGADVLKNLVSRRTTTSEPAPPAR